MLISQTFRGSPTLTQAGFELLQKWSMLTNAQKHEIIKGVADGLRNNTGGTQIKDKLAQDINQAVSPGAIANLKY